MCWKSTLWRFEVVHFRIACRDSNTNFFASNQPLVLTPSKTPMWCRRMKKSRSIPLSSSDIIFDKARTRALWTMNNTFRRRMEKSTRIPHFFSDMAFDIARSRGLWTMNSTYFYRKMEHSRRILSLLLLLSQEWSRHPWTMIITSFRQGMENSKGVSHSYSDIVQLWNRDLWTMIIKSFRRRMD